MREISIIVPVYNKKNTIKNAISSVLNQTFEDFELLLIDQLVDRLTADSEDVLDLGNRVAFLILIQCYPSLRVLVRTVGWQLSISRSSLYQSACASRFDTP